MPVQLREIPNLMLEKRKVEGGITKRLVSIRFNETIEQQGLKKIGINREKLAEIIHEYNRRRYAGPMSHVPKWNKLEPLCKEFYLKQADAIISSEKEILEVKNDRA